VAGVAALALAAAWLIRYPDVISARIEITTARPPVRVVAQASGRIVRMLVTRDAQPVRAGELLAVIESAADVDEVLALRRQLEAGAPPAGESCGERRRELGELEAPYAEYVRRCRERSLADRRLGRHDRLAQLRAQIASFARIGQRLESQRKLLDVQVGLAARRHTAAQELAERRYAPADEVAELESAYLTRKAAREKAEADVLDNHIRIEEAKRAIVDLEYDVELRGDDIALALDEAEKRLRGALATWERRYLLRAAVDGEVWLFRYWSTNQHVKEGEEVMVVVPEKADLIGRVLLPELNSGKIALGQRVNIRVDRYRVSEVGLVRGVVDGIAPVARDGHYLVNVRLPEGLKTSYGVSLRLGPEMHGAADIVTEELRLVERAFYQFRHLFTTVTGAP
jgi:multidrug resistance efflux pump